MCFEQSGYDFNKSLGKEDEWEGGSGWDSAGAEKKPWQDAARKLRRRIMEGERGVMRRDKDEDQSFIGSAVFRLHLVQRVW